MQSTQQRWELSSQRKWWAKWMWHIAKNYGLLVSLIFAQVRSSYSRQWLAEEPVLKWLMWGYTPSLFRSLFGSRSSFWTQYLKCFVENVILKCPFLKGKVERLYATISNIIRIPFKLCWESEFQDSILCISPRGNFNIHEKILLRESIREIQSTLVEYVGPLKTLSDI